MRYLANYKFARMTDSDEAGASAKPTPQSEEEGLGDDGQKHRIEYAKSFASHPKAKYWSEQNDISPRDVALHSHKKMKFNCPECKHTFEAPISKIAIGRWCPFCGKSTRKLCDSNECKHCFNHSFASHPKAKYWSEQNTISPREVALQCNKKFVFGCPTCKHTFETSIDKVVIGKWCPYCCKITKKLCDNNECKHCIARSFASHPKSKYLSTKNAKTAREVTLGSDDKYYFNCSKCKHNFEASPHHVTRKNNPTWCPYCKHKTELKLLKWLNRVCQHQIITQKIFDGLSKSRFDFYIEEFKLIIELDGPQHYKLTSNWQNPKLTQQADVVKMRWAFEHGITVIRLLQEDVWTDSRDWQSELQKELRLHKKTCVKMLHHADEYMNSPIIKSFMNAE